MNYGFQRSFDLTLTFNKSTDRVFFVEADKDFVDVLLSFLTLPLGTIISIVNGGRINDGGPIHCLGNLYQSLRHLKEDQLVDPAVCKEMLLKPRHAAELQCLDLIFNFEHDRALTYYACNQTNCRHKALSPYMGTKCKCGGDMSREMKVAGKMTGKKGRNEGVFLKGTARYIITDNFHIKPVSTQAVLKFVDELGDDDKRDLEEKSFKFGKDQVRSLLYWSMISEKPFTALLANAEKGDHQNDIDESIRQSLSRSTLTSQEISSSDTSIKLIVDNHENKVLYAECNEKFIDSIFRFFTYPPGYVVKKLNENCHITCFDNLYASANSAMTNHFKTDSKNYIVNPSLQPSFFKSNKGFTKVQETHTSNIKKMQIIAGASINGFVCEDMYIVTDELVVNPSISSVTCLIANAIEGVRELAANVGEGELSLLLKASLCSKTALTDVFLN